LAAIEAPQKGAVYEHFSDHFEGLFSGFLPTKKGLLMGA
jgi:hypothetical protein